MFTAAAPPSGAAEDLPPDDTARPAAYAAWSAAGSSAQYYRENAAGPPLAGRGAVPTGVSCFPHEIVLPVRALADRIENISWWREHSEGGHFAALEVPELLSEDLRDFFRPLRT